MGIRALHYITGDTQKTGFRRIGGSGSFPADNLPYLNNRERLSERARVISSGNRPGGGGIQLLSRVWEYQTGDYGCPVIIQTMVAIGTGRAHGFSEYVMGDTKEIADLGEPWQVIQAAEKSSVMLDIDRFMAIPGREEIESPDETWNIEDEEPAPSFEQPMDKEWQLTLLSHYWKQASMRAFSNDPPASIRVFLGEFSEDPTEDNEKTIQQAKRFFADVIVHGLPKQVQNIASMAAGVNGGDMNTLYTALEFDVSQNRDGENTFTLMPRQRYPRAYRLNAAEREFIETVAEGTLPEAVQELFRRYCELADQEDVTETNTPFMADYRLLYDIYCLDQITREKHAFIEKADLEKQLGNNGKASDARICFLLLRNIRSYLEKDHKLNDIRKNLATELLEPLETATYQVMLESMEQKDAEPFMARRNDMLEVHRRTLYYATENQAELLKALTIRDQQAAKAAPQFVRCFPETPLRNADADARNSEIIGALMRDVIRPLIENETENRNEKIANKYLNELRSEAFIQWIQSAPQTRDAFFAFLREEIQDAGKHFLLYGITKEYLPPDELLKNSFHHLTENNTKINTFPSERQIRVVQNDFNRLGRSNPECIEAMNRYYLACFREYRGGIHSIRQHDGVDLVEEFGQDTTGAMVLIFSEDGKERRMLPEEARAVFRTFGGPQSRSAKSPAVIQAYSDMLDTHRKQALKTGDEDAREQLVEWLTQMSEAAPFTVDTAANIQGLFENGSTGSRMKRNTVEKIFTSLLLKDFPNKDQIRQAFKAMVQEQFEAALANHDPEILDWVSGMISVSGRDFPLDTTDILKRVFEAGKEGERLNPAEVGTAFETMGANAEGLDTKVRRAYDEMLDARRAEALEKQDKDAFEWMCDMVNKAPWKDAEWISEQHSENLAFLCDLHEKNGTDIDNTSLSMISGWVKEGTINAKGRDRLQRLCNDALTKQNDKPAEMFSDGFVRINENYPALQAYQFEKARKDLTEALESKRAPYGQMVTEAASQTERSGRKLDDLYDQVRTPVNEYLTEYFAKNTEIAPLIRELDEIPPDNRFYTEWRNRLSEQVNSQQVALFNNQPNLEKVLSLRDEILSYGSKMDPALRSAYQLIETTEKSFDELKKADEIGAVAAVGGAASEFDRLLAGASEVRKKLCSVLAEQAPDLAEMRKISFRHALCSEVIKAELTDDSGADQAGGKNETGGPEWIQLLHHLFSKQELMTAAKKPYDAENLPVLQRLLAVLENVRMMKAYGLKDEWADQLVKTIHSDHDFHAYQSALGRNRKKCEQYQLEFDSDGLVFNMTIPD